jgi:hypothetical protein
MIAAIGIAVMVILMALGRTPDPPVADLVIASVVGVVVVLILLLFSSLTVSVDGETVEAGFGPGLIRKRFPTARIVQAKPVRNSWWYGWGIRLTPHGWLYNVSGLDAVELLMGDGRTYRIGTDEPEALAAAINTARMQR